MDAVKQQSATKPVVLLGTFAVVSVLYFTAKVIYTLFFHPLHEIPGPRLNALSRIPYARHLLAGTTADNVKRLHDKYGEVVRVSPNEISFISGETAWQDIYGFRTGKMKGHQNIPKDPSWYPDPPKTQHILTSNDEDHARFRKTLSHAFSEKALAGQEILLQGYVDLLVNRLKEVIAGDDTAQDMTKWYNWATFDIIADLMFGQPFGCLQDLSTHKYIALLLNSIQSFHFSYIISHWPWTKYLSSFVIDTEMMERRVEYYAWVSDKVQERIDRDTQRPDFMTEILKHNGDKGATLTPDEIGSNAAIILTAGSETTATLLSGVTWCLLQTPEVMQKLKDEVRGLWKTSDEITIDQVNKAPYLIAVLTEALRFFPPVPTGFERRVGKGGVFVSGYYIPEGTGLCVSSWPSGHSERNFADPDSFVPERWMGDPRYENDNKAAMQPFSFGPRNCLGKNLAYAEMRLILAKMVWSFDMELDPKSRDWMKECKVLTLWDKPELAVHLKEVVR